MPTSHSPSRPVIYRVDSDDRIVESTEPGNVGSRLWSHIADDTTVRIYEELLERVRDRQVPVTFQFRCDTPDLRRMHRMTIAPAGGLLVEFRVSIDEVQTRIPVPILDASAERDGRVLTACGWCKRMPTGDGEWHEIEVAVQRLGLLSSGPLPRLSHGICPACLDTMMKAIGADDAGPVRCGTMPAA